jgi:hypothetical protein
MLLQIKGLLAQCWTSRFVPALAGQFLACCLLEQTYFARNNESCETTVLKCSWRRRDLNPINRPGIDACKYPLWPCRAPAKTKMTPKKSYFILSSLLPPFRGFSLLSFNLVIMTTLDGGMPKETDCPLTFSRETRLTRTMYLSR